MHNDDKSLIQTEAKLWELIEKSKKVLLAKKSMFFRIELGPSNYGLLFTLKRAGFIYRYVKGRGNTYTVWMRSDNCCQHEAIINNRVKVEYWKTTAWNSNSVTCKITPDGYKFLIVTGN